MKFAVSSAATFALLASSASAHLFISSPVPIAGTAIKDPLAGDGSNFPCHGVALPGSGGTAMPVGSAQTLRFDTGNGANTAVHGGGSCQLSLTYETDPTMIKDPTNWKVIYSIEGGCPTNSPMNLDQQFPGPQGTYTGAYQCDDPKTNGYDCANIFNFSIPQGVKNGQATLAWTWFNNVGNREIYMNCVAVDITGGSDDASAMSSFPSMFVANIASINGGTCKTTEQQNVGFPDPGQYLLQRKASSDYPVPTAKDYPIVTPSGCGAVVAAATTAAASAAVTTAAAGVSSVAPVVTSAAAAQPSTLATSAAAAASSGTSTARKGKKTKTRTVKKASNTGGAASPPQPAATGSSSCASGSVPCGSGVNSILCVDNYHFGICDYNGCAISQPVAAGTMCKNGAITWATKHKRHFNLHRHAKMHS